MESRLSQGPSLDENSFGNGNTVEYNDGVSMQRIGRVGNFEGVSAEGVITGKWSEKNAGGSYDGNAKRCV